MYLAEDQTTNVQVAAKILRSEHGKVSACELYQLAHVQGHRHIVQLHDGVCNPYLLIMLMESGCMSLHQYLKGGGSFPSSSGGSVPPLGSALPKLSGGIAPKPFAVALGHQIASALDHIHSKDIIHRDLYSKNIVFRQDGTAMLVDFGMSVHVTTGAGTNDYITLFIFWVFNTKGNSTTNQRYSFGLVVGGLGGFWCGVVTWPRGKRLRDEMAVRTHNAGVGASAGGVVRSRAHILEARQVGSCQYSELQCVC